VTPTQIEHRHASVRRALADDLTGRPPRTRLAPVHDLAATRTDVVLHPGAATVRGRNLLWCATTQRAWDALADEVQRLSGKGPDLRLGPPAGEDLVAAMNRREFPHGDLDAASCVVESGLAGTGVVARFLERVRALGGAFALDLSGVRPDEIVALAYLRKDLPFAQPFLVHEGAMAFDGGASHVAAFGMASDGTGPAQGAMLAQLRLHDARADGDDPDREPDEFALELRPRADGDRIVLGRIAPPSTLVEGWRRMAALLARPETRLDAHTALWIPKIDFAATHRFRELEGALVLDAPPAVPPTKVRDVREVLEFTLSEEGARLVAAVVMATNNTVGIQPGPRVRRLMFDRPFLLAMVRDGAATPYFLAWFGNDALFVRR
jgi:hypothetical protein